MPSTLPLRDVGLLATNWEAIESTVEIAILELSGCPDYRARALTTYLSFRNKWSALRVLLINEFGKPKVAKHTEFASVQKDIETIRQHRNAIVHADWTEFSLEEDPVIEAPGTDARYSLTGSQITYKASDIRRYVDLSGRAHLDLLNFLTGQCGIVPLHDKYALPLGK